LLASIDQKLPNFDITKRKNNISKNINSTSDITQELKKYNKTSLYLLTFFLILFLIAILNI